MPQKFLPLMWDPDLKKKVGFICFNESPLKMMNTFILKVLFVLKIFKFLP